MPTFPLHFLSLAGSLSVVTAMPEPLLAPPIPAYTPLDGPGRYPFGDNMTGPPPGALEAYCQMLLQTPVPVPDKIPWFCQSTSGPKGDQGDRGDHGPPGSSGRRGVTGFRGPPGFTGRQGVKGQKGDEGQKGDRGLPGFVGPKGGRGFKGDKGEPGLEGRSGNEGPKGDDGVCPDACESSQGPLGPPGVPGPAGTRGPAGTPGLTGPKGLKGDMGDLGHTGPPGSVGRKGESGLQGECNCTDGVDGGPGQKGDQGDQGDQGQMGSTGQMGPQGEKGDMGHMGMMGRPGPCMPSIQSAFAAGLTSSYPPPNAPVVFSQVLYNRGSYDPGTGLFTAPINGTYVFSYHLTVHQRVLKVGLFHNFLPVVKNTYPKALGTTSHSVVLHLARGDRVWIQVKDQITNGMYAGSESSSTFSGFLLHPDMCDMTFLRAPVPLMSSPEGGFNWGDGGSGTTEPPTPPAGGGSD